MAVERDANAERLARMNLLFAEMKVTLTRMAPTDRIARQHLCDQLDKMLAELRGPYNVARRRALTLPWQLVNHFDVPGGTFPIERSGVRVFETRRKEPIFSVPGFG